MKTDLFLYMILKIEKSYSKLIVEKISVFCLLVKLKKVHTMLMGDSI